MITRARVQGHGAGKKEKASVYASMELTGYLGFFQNVAPGWALLYSGLLVSPHQFRKKLIGMCPWP